MMKGKFFLASFGTMIVLCLLVFTSEAQVKNVNTGRAASPTHKRWSPLSGNGLQHALANASRKHFDPKPAIKEAASPAPMPAPAVSGWPMGFFDMRQAKHPKLLARR